MLEQIKEFFTQKWRWRPEVFLWGLFVVAGAGGIYLLAAGRLDLSDGIRYFGATGVIISVLYASFQFRANHDWNRRQLAITAAREEKEGMNKHLILLDESFDFVHRKKSSPISVDEIHGKICCKQENGEYKSKNGKLVLDCSERATAVRRAIHHVLNSYEYLATGVYQGVFDQEIIEALYRGSLLKTYHVFALYIEHNNKEMYPERNNRVWQHFRDFALELEAAEETRTQKRKKAD